MTARLQDLLARAREAAQHSYSPYSRFRVGAALEWEGGLVSTGTNVENASYGLAICAERSAVVQAVGQGARKLRAVAIWVEAETIASPCGACRQVLVEFADWEETVPVILGGRPGERESSLQALVPEPFKLQVKE